MNNRHNFMYIDRDKPKESWENDRSSEPHFQADDAHRGIKRKERAYDRKDIQSTYSTLASNAPPAKKIKTGESKSSAIPEFVGEYKDNYATLYHQTNHETDNSFMTLGEISDDPRYYFIESSTSKYRAANFLEAFWTKEDNRLATIKYHQDKYYDQDISDKPLYPQCISFIFPEINKKLHCFISLSGWDKVSVALQDRLIAFITQFNAEQKESAIEYTLINGDTRNFSRLVRGANEERNDTHGQRKNCAEKYYSSALTKLYSEFGKNIYVKGATTWCFYPYNENDNYGTQKYSVDKTVMPPIRRDGYQRLKGGLVATRLHPCVDCQDNRKALFKIWKTAQNLATPELDQRIVITSPLRNSFATESSLLSLTVFAAVKTEKKEQAAQKAQAIDSLSHIRSYSPPLSK